MGLKPKFTQKDFQQRLEAGKAKIEAVIETELGVLMIKATNDARTARGYTDQTGNLVNSTGGVILKDGNNIYEDYKETVSTGTEGVKKGQDTANEVAEDFSGFKGYTLIMTAGMEYAAPVEYRYGKNVLAATELYVRAEMPKTIAKIEAAAKKIKI